MTVEDDDIIDDAMGCLGFCLRYLFSPAIALLALIVSWDTADQQQVFQAAQRARWERNDARFQPRLTFVSGDNKSHGSVLTIKNESATTCAITGYRFEVDSEPWLASIARVEAPPVNNDEPYAVTARRSPSIDNTEKTIQFTDGQWTDGKYTFYADGSEHLRSGDVTDITFILLGEKWEHMNNGLSGRLYIEYDGMQSLELTKVHLPRPERLGVFRPIP